MKKILCLAFAIVVLLSLSIPAFAAENGLKFSSSKNSIHPRGVLSLAGTLVANSWIMSDDIYYVHDGNMTIHISSCTWSPSSQEIEIGLFNVDTRKHITVTLSGGETGSANVTTNGVPAGDYSVSILNNGPKEVTVAMSYSVTIT